MPGPARGRSSREPARIGIRLLPLLVAAVTVLGALTLPPVRTHALSFAVISDRAMTVAMVAGLGLATAGVVAAASRRGTGLAVALAVAAAAWLAPEVVAREDAPAVARTVAGLVVPLLAPALLHVGLATGSWPRESRRRRLLVTGYGAVAGLAAVRALVWSPALDPDCWSNCTDNVLLVVPAPVLASGLTTVLDVATVLVAAGAAAVALGTVRATVAADRTASGTALWVAVPLLAASAAVAVHAGTRAVRPFETPLDVTYVRLFEVRAGTLAVLAAGVVALVLVELRRRLALAAALDELSDVARGRALEELLRDATGDPGLRVLYPVPGVGGLLDAQGRRHPRPDPHGDHVVTPLVRGGHEVAIVVHDAPGVGIDELRRAAGPAARLAVDNERLRAELLLRLAELRASRARLVEAGDSERRVLERDLHDGAQHRLLALGHDVRRAREAAGDRDDELTSALESAERGVHEAVAELRAVARGLYPAVLTADGLEGALWSLSDSAPVPLEIVAVPGRRYPEPVERTVYAVTTEAAEAARRHEPDGAGGVSVEVRETGGRLVVRVDGAVGPPPLTVVDRVGAVGGAVEVRRNSWHVELPCG